MDSRHRAIDPAATKSKTSATAVSAIGCEPMRAMLLVLAWTGWAVDHIPQSATESESS